MKIRNYVTALSATVLLVAGLVSTAYAGERIRIASEGAWAPFNYIDKSGELKGFDIDIAKALCEEMDAECTFVAQDWDGILPGLMMKKYDAIVASMSITPERQRVVDFTDPYYSNSLIFIGPKDEEFDTSRAGLKGKTIGAQRATIAGIYLEDNLADVVNIKFYDTQDKAYLDLVNGRLDGLLSDKLPAYNWLKTEAGSDFEFKGENVASDDKIGIAVRKGSPLREKFNKALQAILEDGTYEEINAKYFPFSIY